MASPRTIRVAAAQLPANNLANAQKSLGQIEQAIADAAAKDVDLLVLPECAYPAYCLGSAAA
jgi:predicted amidohydrolase